MWVGRRGGLWLIVALKDTFECDIVAFQRLLFRKTAPKLPTCEDEGACNPKE